MMIEEIEMLVAIVIFPIVYTYSLYRLFKKPFNKE